MKETNLGNYKKIEPISNSLAFITQLDLPNF